MMQMNKIAFVLLSLIFLGCANKLNMGYYSAVQKDYFFNVDAPMVVVADKNDLLSGYYVNLIIYELQRQGFTGVYKQGDLPVKRAKIVIHARLFRGILSYPSVNYSYSMVNDGITPSCYWYGDQFYCGSGNQTFALTGYSEQLNYSSSYQFVLDWRDLNLRKRVLYVNGSVTGNTCGYNMLFRDLIVNTIARIDFSRTEKYAYYSPLPYYWPCR